MILENFIVRKLSTFLNTTIHITPTCNVHLHGHQNKMVPLMKPSILANLNKALSFAITLISQIMTFETIVSRIESITTTSVTQT